MEVKPLASLDLKQFETVAILKKVAAASRQLAELKGVAATIPNQGILIDTLFMQEAKESSAIENIVTTHDELFKQNLFPEIQNVAAKEVKRYVEALRVGFELVFDTGLITTNHILKIQEILEANDAGFRKLPGTSLQNNSGEIVYMPPQEPLMISALMQDLEQFINTPSAPTLDPLLKMAIMHHQFETIHPFYDGNGRTGRMMNVLYLVQEGLLDIPVLYMSGYINKHKSEYYKLLQSVRDDNNWQPWIIYMLEAVETTAKQTIQKIVAMREMMMQYKHQIRSDHKFYSQDLINHLFKHPYTKITLLADDIKVTRLTATKYLDSLVKDGLLTREKKGRNSYYINPQLINILIKD
jgi:Fic family protein